MAGYPGHGRQVLVAKSMARHSRSPCIIIFLLNATFGQEALERYGYWCVGTLLPTHTYAPTPWKAGVVGLKLVLPVVASKMKAWDGDSTL